MSTAGVRGSVTPADLAGVAWHISSRSSSGTGNCVEAGPVADGSGRVAVRHSHHPGDATFVYSRAAWAAFIGAAKHGDFDLPT